MTSLEEQLKKIQHNISNCYKVMSDNGSIIPSLLNMNNLPKTVDNSVSGSTQEPGLDILGQILSNQITSLENSTVTQIPAGTFADCTNLISISLPNVTTMYDNVFSGCTNLVSVNLPKCEYIHSTPESGSSYYYYEVPLPRGENALTFENCTSLETLSLPKLKEVEQSTFCSSSIKTLILNECEKINCMGFTKYDDSEHMIESVSYIDSKLENITIPNCKTIEEGAFLGCPKLEKLDLQNIESIGRYAFRDCTSLQKVWIPSTCETISETSGTPTSYPFNGCSCVVFTDALSAMQGWGAHWDYNGSATQIPVVWGATHENYINGTTPTYKNSVSVTGPENSTVVITYFGLDTTGSGSAQTTAMDNTSGTYTIRLNGYLDYTREFTVIDSNVSIQVSQSELTQMPSTLNITYNTIDSNTDVLSKLIDGNNFIKNTNLNAITSGPSSYGIQGGSSKGYIEIQPTSNVTLSITCYGSYDTWSDSSAIYVGTDLYYPTYSQIQSETTDSKGSYIFNGYYYVNRNCQTSKTYTLSLTSGTHYYISFVYYRDSYWGHGEDRLIVTSIQAS